MRKLIFLNFAFILSISSFAQIGGLSASKLNTMSATVVPHNKIEFEPSFSITKNTGIFDNDARLLKYNDSIFENGFGFRFTFGAFKNTEIGCSLPIELNEFLLGAKYLLFSNEKILLSAFGGISMDFTVPDFVSQIGGGGILTLRYTDKISSDLQFGYLNNTNKNIDKNAFFFNMDHGIYIGDIQYIIGMNYYTNFSANTKTELWITSGVTIEPAKNYLLVLMYSKTVFGKNTFQNQGFSFALTITLD